MPIDNCKQMVNALVLLNALEKSFGGVSRSVLFYHNRDFAILVRHALNITLSALFSRTTAEVFNINGI